jgi:hypothetical protein
MSRLVCTAPHGTSVKARPGVIRSSPHALAWRSGARMLVWALATLAMAAILTWASVANPRAAPAWDLLDAGPAPSAPPYVDDDADAPYADAGEPYCDACTTRAMPW